VVDSQVVLQDGTAYDVRWLLAKYGNGYKVRDDDAFVASGTTGTVRIGGRRLNFCWSTVRGPQS
jgi:hypothetical protein